jgi:hypothetical protein
VILVLVCCVRKFLTGGLDLFSIEVILFCTISSSRPQWLGSCLLLILLCTGLIVPLCFSVSLVHRPVLSSVLICPLVVFFSPSYEPTARFELWIFRLHRFCQAKHFSTESTGLCELGVRPYVLPPDHASRPLFLLAVHALLH